MDPQHFFNLVGGSALAALGWFARTLYAAIEKLKGDLNDHKIIVARDYVSNHDLDEIKTTLVRIEAAVHAKADR